MVYTCLLPASPPGIPAGGLVLLERIIPPRAGTGCGKDGYLTFSRAILTAAGDGDAELCGTRIPNDFPCHPYRGRVTGMQSFAVPGYLTISRVILTAGG